MPPILSRRRARGKSEPEAAPKADSSRPDAGAVDAQAQIRLEHTAIRRFVDDREA